MWFEERLARAVQRGHLCVGIDPVPERLPESLKDAPDAVARFCEAIVRATAPFVAAFKPNLAFFEALGREGDTALERTIEAVRMHAPEAVLIGDAKRGDIGSTAQRYASALFDRWGFDAATVNPWFGADGIVPFTERAEHGAILLAATSNPSAAQVQEIPGEPLYLRIARLAAGEWNSNRNVGLVVGATRTKTMDAIRAAGPELSWLIPGIGAQGGDLEAAVKRGIGERGVPSVISASRSVLYASAGEDFAEAAGAEAERLAGEINRAVAEMQTGTFPGEPGAN